MKIHSYQRKNPKYNAPTAKVSTWFGLCTKEYFFNVHLDEVRWCCCETGNTSPYSSELSLYGTLQNILLSNK
jgi:hypothetical protein